MNSLPYGTARLAAQGGFSLSGYLCTLCVQPAAFLAEGRALPAVLVEVCDGRVGAGHQVAQRRGGVGQPRGSPRQQRHRAHRRQQRFCRL